MRTIILTIFLVSSLMISGQVIKVPTHYELKKAEDYKPYEDSVRMTANWMIKTALFNERAIRESANSFLFRWVSGAPTTHIDIRGEFTNDVLSDKSNVFAYDLLLNYIAGMVIVKLDDNNAADLLAQEAGVKAMLEGYKSICETYKNAFLEKLLKIEKKGKLTKWINDNAKVYGPQDKTKIIPKD